MGGKIIIHSITFGTLAKAWGRSFSACRRLHTNSSRCGIAPSRASSRRGTTTNRSFVTHDRSDCRPRHGIVLGVRGLIKWWVMMVADGGMGVVFWNLRRGARSRGRRIRRRRGRICCSQYWRRRWMLRSRYPRLECTCDLRSIHRLNMTTLSRSARGKRENITVLKMDELGNKTRKVHWACMNTIHSY